MNLRESRRKKGGDGHYGSLHVRLICRLITFENEFELQVEWQPQRDQEREREFQT